MNVLQSEIAERSWSSGLRYEDLRQKTGLPASTISGIITGRLKPTDRELALLAQALQISPPSRLLQPVRVVVDEEPSHV